MKNLFKQSLLTIFLLLFTHSYAYAVAADATLDFSTFGGTGTTTLSNTDFDITGTGGGITMNLKIASGVAWIDDTTDNLSWIVTFSANGTTTGSFELTNVNFSEYLTSDNYTNLSLVGNVKGGGIVSSTNTLSPGNNGIKDIFTGTDFGMTNFAGVQLTSFEFRFDSTLAGGEDMELNSFTIANAQAPVTSKAEPTNHPTAFTATADSTSQITTAWTDDTSGAVVPDSYLLMCSTSNTFTDPVDGTAQTDDTDCSDGAGVQNIAQGVGTVAWTGLTSGTQYYYKIFPYTNTGTDVDYKIDGTVGIANATTTALVTYSISIALTTNGAENGAGTPTDAVYTVTVTPSNATGGAITGDIAYSGTATNGTDYATGATSFSIADGASTATITLDITEDTDIEGTETAIATISAPSTGSIGTASATANITDDDSYSISIALTTNGAENGAGTPTNAVYTVTVIPSNNTGGAITGDIAYSGTATNGTDYATGATSFSIADGASTATITLDITEDTDIEGTETAIATISTPSTGSIGTASATANITDDDTIGSDATLTSSSTITEPINLPSIADTVGEAVSLFDFTLTDGGGGDGLSTDVSQIVLHTSGTADFSKVAWQLNGADASNVLGVYDAGANTLTFSGLSISVADGANETYTVSGYYSTATGLTNKQTYILSLDGDDDLTLSASGTQMSGGNTAVNNGTGTLVDITASKLIFQTLPSNSNLEEDEAT